MINIIHPIEPNVASAGIINKSSKIPEASCTDVQDGVRCRHAPKILIIIISSNDEIGPAVPTRRK